ncbi:MAG: winged helix-turn-helix transcriptional regulator [Clostridia bacterium]|nr:winged helix-turn-helix transcriptional regulator [Clostridia bacterium]
MKQIDIICNDKIYTELLCLELSDRGYKTSDKNSGRADVILIEADYHGNENTVTFSKKEGADLVRPFDIEELVSLIESKNIKESFFDELYVSQSGCYAVYKENEISLTELEHKILCCLYEAKGEYVTAEELAARFFDGEDKNTVRVYISYLRNKLDESFGIKFIYTARGKGYKLVRS